MPKLRITLILLIVCLAGCSNLTRQDEEEISRWILPVNAVASYFGAVAWHEGGHAFTAMGIGGKDIRISFLPKKDHYGNQHLALTSTRLDDPSGLEITLFNVMGPTAAWFGHISVRGLLRSGRIPRLIQPSLAWFGFANQLGYYSHVIMGLARSKSSDLGKEDVWISVAMLAGGLTIDLVDLLTDGPDHYFGVLGGQYFYEGSEDHLEVVIAPQDGGGFLGILAKW